MAKKEEPTIPVSHGYVHWRITKISAEQIKTYADSMPSINERLAAYYDPDGIDYRNLRVLRNAVIADYDKLSRKKQEAFFTLIYSYNRLVEYTLNAPLKERKKLLHQFGGTWSHKAFKLIQKSIQDEEKEITSPDNRNNLFADAATAAYKQDLDQFQCPVCGHTVALRYRSDGKGFRADCDFCDSQVSRWNHDSL